jgi:hypothetical protein
MLDRLARPVTPQDIGRHVASEMTQALPPTMNEDTRALLAPCLRHLQAAVERCCASVVRATGDGVDHGPLLAAGEILVAAASRNHACVFTLREMPSEKDLPDIHNLPEVAFWDIVGAAVDVSDIGILRDAVTARIGMDELRNLFARAAELHESKAGIAILYAASTVGTRAAGALFAIPVPIIRLDEARKKRGGLNAKGNQHP